MSQLLEVKDLRFRYGKKSEAGKGVPWTLDRITMSIESSSTLGIVGESGSGKSTLVRVLCGLLPLASGEIVFEDRDIASWLKDSPRDFRRRNQIVFQNPKRSLDPRMRVKKSLSQPVRALERRAPTERELTDWLEQVGLGAEVLDRYPHQLSGGQLQRIGIARALSVGPSILYADEPTSALDVSVQAQVLNLLMDLRSSLGLSLVMVSHDLAVVGRLTEHLIVMKEGVVVEAGDTADLLSRPRQAYTASLVEAATAVSLNIEHNSQAQGPRE
jgi:peptide/nickel transport system ATP-binding protein